MEADYNTWTIMVGLSGAFGLGMCFSLLGSIAVKMMPKMNIDQAKFGTMISAFMFSSLIASLVVGVVTDTIGFQAVAMIGFLAAAACVFMLAYARSNAVAVAACVLLGVGAMACNTTGNVLGTSVVSNLFDGDAAAANNLVNVFFGLGLFLTPFVASLLLERIAYEKAVSVIGVILLLPVLFVLPATFPEASAGFVMADALALLAEPVTIVAALVLFCYISLEMSFSNWLAPFGKEVISADKKEWDTGRVDASAARLLSAFAIAMMIGRLITSFSGITQFQGWVIAGGALASMFIIYAMTNAKTASSAYGLAALAGLLFAPIFPTTVGVTFSKLGASGSLFGIIFAVGLAGAVIVPKAIGNMAKGKSSVQKSLKLLLPPCAALVVLAVILHMLPAKGVAVEDVPAAVVEAVEDVSVEVDEVLADEPLDY